MGLIAGFFYAYASSVMPGLALADDLTFIAAMQAVNTAVSNGAFAVGFFGALLATAAATLLTWRSGGAARVLSASALALYVGAVAITVGVSVPLNDQLAQVGAAQAAADPAAVRTAFEGRWVSANTARTAMSIGAFSCLVTALLRISTDRRPRTHGGI